MSQRSRPRASDVPVRRPKSGPAADAHRRDPAIDSLGFAVFAGFLILAFTQAIPDQFALPKLLGIHVYVAFCAARWIFAVRQGRVQDLPRPLALATAALAGWCLATTLTAQHVATALFGMRGRYNGLTTLLAGLALFVFIATTRTSERGLEWRLGTISVVLTVAAAWGVIQAAGLDRVQWPQGRPPSTLGHPVVLAGALAMVLPLTLAFALDAGSRAARWACGAMAVVQALALTLTLARGAWVGAACGLVFFAVLAVAPRRALLPRLAAVAAGAILGVGAILAASTPMRAEVFGRVSTLASLGDDVSVSYRLHFCRAALAMLRDHPWTGVGLENFGLLYPAYRSAPTPAIVPDLVPTMVHSGPLQTAVSGGVPALALQLLFFAAALSAVVRRRRDERDERQRLLGSAFIASAIACAVQDLSGWPHVVSGALAFVIGGLGVSWSLGSRAQPDAGRRMWREVAAWTVIAGSAWLSLVTWERLRAERLMFEAQSLDVKTSWGAAERRMRAALAASPDPAWASDAAARLCLRRAAAVRDRHAYEWGVQLIDAARAENPFDPYIRLRRAELDLAALDRGLLPAITDAGRSALNQAKAMAGGSILVRKIEAALLRRAGTVSWISPQAAVGFGPQGSLIVGGTAPGASAGAHVFLHWRNVARDGAWITEANAPLSAPDGTWHNAIANVRDGDEYEVYATFESGAWGRCTYPGSGSIQLCAPLALVAPAPPGTGPPGSLVVGGVAPEDRATTPLLLHWRNPTRRAAWRIQPLRSTGSGEEVAYPPDAPGNWYTVIPGAGSGEPYEFFVSSPKKARDPCTYPGDGSPAFCSPISWIQPQAMAGFGPPGSLVVAGSASGALDGAPVFLHWRNATRHSAWTTESATPAPDARGHWYNAIPNARLDERYEVFITVPTTVSNTCVYAGDGRRSVCP